MDQKGSNALPSQIFLGMSSLGYQWTIEILARAGFSVERVFFQTMSRNEKNWRCTVQLRAQTPLSHFKVVGSHWLMVEMAGFMQCLELAESVRFVKNVPLRPYLYRLVNHLFEPTPVITIRRDVTG